MKIPFEDLREVNAPMAKELEAAASRVIRSGRYVLGEEVMAFENEFAAYIGVKHCVGVNSGLDALTLSLISLDLPKSAEVLLPAHTFAATALSVIHAGLKPVLVDADLETFNIDLKKIEQAISSKTKAIIAVHLYGRPVDMHALTDICKRHGLTIIEDAAQAHGATFQTKKIGSFGRLSAFSFYPAKNLSALGDAGAVLTDDGELADKVRELRNYGSAEKYRYNRLGFNSRMDELQAALLRVKLKYLDAHNTFKRNIAKRYCDKLSSKTLALSYDENSVYHIFPIIHSERDRLRKQLAKEDIDTGLHYAEPFHTQQPFKDYFSGANMPVTEQICAQELSLPISVALDELMQDKVIASINQWA